MNTNTWRNFSPKTPEKSRIFVYFILGLQCPISIMRILDYCGFFGDEADFVVSFLLDLQNEFRQPNWFGPFNVLNGSVIPFDKKKLQGRIGRKDGKDAVDIFRESGSLINIMFHRKEIFYEWNPGFRITRNKIPILYSSLIRHISQDMNQID